jgi:hypothetical protein
LKTTDGNAPGHFPKAVFANELVQNMFERDSVQRVTRMGDRLGHTMGDGFDFTVTNYHEINGFVQREERFING